MADFLWSLSAAQLPEALTDWQRLVNGLRYPEAEPRPDLNPSTRLMMWTFRGEQPLAGGLAVLFAEFFRWLGPSFEFLSTRFERDGDGLLPWNSEMMQIDPSTFVPEYAVPDARLWGELAADGLTVHFENGSERQQWALNGDLIQIVTQLIGLAPEIFNRIGLHVTDWQPDEALDISDTDALAVLLRAWGELNIRYELVKAGYEDYSDALDGAIRRTTWASLTGSRFACWAACRALWPVAADSDIPHQESAEETLVNLASVFPRVAWPGIALSLVEWERGDYERATDLLETAIESDPRVRQAWHLLAILYEELNQIEKAITACREAIRAKVADAAIYYNLGGLLLEHGENPDNDQAEIEEAAVQEALQMLQQAEALGLRAPELYLRLMDAHEALDDEPGLWDAFGRLIENDSDGAVLWQVVEDADTYETFEPGLERLRQAAEQAPNDYGRMAAYVRALIVLDRHADAVQVIPALRAIANDDYARAEAAQLALEATAPDFEEAYGELADDIEAGQVPDAGMLGLLQEAFAREPAFADGAVLLAQAYQLLERNEEAIQVLSQARDLLPDHLELVLSMADVLWANDNDELALWTMQDSLTRHPNDVALLARLGEYYFEVQEDNLAREYLERAEALDPRHPELVRVREQISRSMADDELTEEYEDEQ